MDRIDCAYYQGYCNDEYWANTMEYYCSATCGFCEGNKTFLNLIFIFQRQLPKNLPNFVPPPLKEILGEAV